MCAALFHEVRLYVNNLTRYELFCKRGRREYSDINDWCSDSGIALQVPPIFIPRASKAGWVCVFPPVAACLLLSLCFLSRNTSVYSYLKKLYSNHDQAGILQEKTDI